MKKRKLFGAAAALSTIASFFGACTPDEVQNVYGPPPSSENTGVGTTRFRSNDYVPQTEYGPPTIEEEYKTAADDDDAADDISEADEPAFVPADNIPQDVYGPPEWFD